MSYVYTLCHTCAGVHDYLAWLASVPATTLGIRPLLQVATPRRSAYSMTGGCVSYARLTNLTVTVRTGSDFTISLLAGIGREERGQEQTTFCLRVEPRKLQTNSYACVRASSRADVVHGCTPSYRALRFAAVARAQLVAERRTSFSFRSRPSRAWVFV